MEDFKVLFGSSKFPWARERIYWKFVKIWTRTSPELGYKHIPVALCRSKNLTLIGLG